MKSWKLKKYLITSLLILTSIACSNDATSLDLIPTVSNHEQIEPTTNNAVDTLEPSEASPAPTLLPVLDEIEVTLLRIPERIEAANFEYSGLGWFGESLVLLPQYPGGKGFTREPNLFAIA